MEFKKKTIIGEENNEPPKNYIGVKDDGKAYEYDYTTRQGVESETIYVLLAQVDNISDLITILASEEHTFSSDKDYSAGETVLKEGKLYMFTEDHAAGEGNEEEVEETSILDILDVSSNKMINITWAKLKDLRDNSKLIPGAIYRITDYQCTTAQAETRSAGHQFDIIVTADSESTLNENAKACLHNGDTYFSNSKLEAWRLNYCIDNDISRFGWAKKAGTKIYTDDELWFNFAGTVDIDGTTWYLYENIQFMYEKGGEYLGTTDAHPEVGNKVSVISADKTEVLEEDYSTIMNIITELEDGKGVIYRMIDEFENDCPYDFKNIQFTRYLITTCEKSPSLIGKYGTLDGNMYSVDTNSIVYAYTFSSYVDSGTVTDNSLIGNCYGNKLEKYKGFLNDIVIFGNGCHYNTFGDDCYSNTFSDTCYYNTFGNGCSSNIFGIGCYSNTFGNSCSSNTFGNGCSSNIFGNGCDSNTFGNSCSSNTFSNNCSSNIFGNGCYSNTFGDTCHSNTFDTDCSANIFGNGCHTNTFSNNCHNNTFGNGCSSNIFGNDCDSNDFDNNCSSNIFGIGCDSNDFDNNCRSNTFSNNCSSNTFGNSCYSNTFGNGCYSNTFSNDCNTNTFSANCYSNDFGNSCHYNTFGDNCVYNTFGNDCYSITFGTDCRSNTFGDYCYTNTFGDYCQYNIFGNNCIYNTFGNQSAAINYVQYVKFGNGCQCLYLVSSDTSESGANYLQNISVAQGLSGTLSSLLTITIPDRNLEYETKVAKNSSSTLKIYCEADLVQ